MTTSTPAELQARYDALTARIVALDREIALETDRERRMVAQSKRDELAMEREQVAGDMTILGVTPHSSGLEQRVGTLEKDVKKLWGFVRPSPRQLTSKLLFYALLVGLWSMWMVHEIRDWLLSHPAQAVAITAAVLVAALIIRWLPEDDHDQR